MSQSYPRTAVGQQGGASAIHESIMERLGRLCASTNSLREEVLALESRLVTGDAIKETSPTQPIGGSIPNLLSYLEANLEGLAGTLRRIGGAF